MEDEKKTSEVAEEALNDSNATDSSDAPAEGNNAVDELGELRDRLDSLAEASQKILDSLEAVRSSMAAFVEGGATIHEDKEDSAVEDSNDDDHEEEVDLETPLDQLDFDLDD